MRYLVVIMLAFWPGFALSDVLTGIAERGKVVLGVRADAPPFSYLDEDTEPAGLAVRLCEEVVARISRQLGGAALEIEHRVVSAKDRFAVLREGQTDIHCGPASATLKRRASLDFSLLYFVDGATLAHRPDSYDALFESRRGRVGALAGTTSVPVAQDLIARNQLDAELVTYPSHQRGLRALADQAIDLYIGDQSILLFQTSALGLTSEIVVREDILSFEPYALVMQHGEDRLRLAIDRALSAIYEEGMIYDMIEAEMQNYPLTPEAEAVYQIVALPE